MKHLALGRAFRGVSRSLRSMYRYPLHRSSSRNRFYRYSTGCALGVVVASAAGNAVAGPEGGDVVGGAGDISRLGNTTTITQHTDRLAIDWQSFDVNVDERVQYVQPDSSSIALNRILSTRGSEIHGRIDANGHVVLVNPNGIVFTENAVINTGGLVASGLDINPNDFMNGDFTFKALEGTEGVVINSGLINAASGGSVALIGQQVENQGLISAHLGRVTLAAGTETVVTFDSNGLLGVRVTEEVLAEDIGVDAAVINSGEINAEDGQILLSASVSQDIFSQAVNRGNLEHATSVVVHEDGSFTLGGGADVVNTGNLNVSGEQGGELVVLGENITSSGRIEANAQQGDGGAIEIHSRDTTLLTENSQTLATGETGGDIKVLGSNVGLADQAEVDTSGDLGGGQILVGGDRTGANDQVRNAEFIYIGEDTGIHANANQDGDGGRVITFAANTARIYGDLSARGGAEGGDGGFIETSGLRGLELDGTPDASAAAGQGGEWLIDPYNITIGESVGTTTTGAPVFIPSAANAMIDAEDIVTALMNGGTVTVETADSPMSMEEGNITLDATISTNTSSTGTLIFNAHGSINAQDNIITDIGSGLNVELNANFDGVGSGYIALAGSTISTNGGYLVLNGDAIGGTAIDPAAPMSSSNSIIGVLGGATGTITTSGGDFHVGTTVGMDMMGNPTFTPNDAVSSDFNHGGTINVSGNLDSGNIFINTNGSTTLNAVTIGDNNVGTAFASVDSFEFTINAQSIAVNGDLLYGNGGVGDDYVVNANFNANESITFTNVTVDNGFEDSRLNLTLNADADRGDMADTDMDGDISITGDSVIFLTGGNFTVTNARNVSLSGTGGSNNNINTQSGDILIGFTDSTGTTENAITGDFNSNLANTALDTANNLQAGVNSSDGDIRIVADGTVTLGDVSTGEFADNAMGVANTSVFDITAQNIAINGDITYGTNSTSSTHTVNATFNARDNITFDGSTVDNGTGSDTLSLTLNANTNSDATGDITINNGSTILLGSGNFQVGSAHNFTIGTDSPDLMMPVVDFIATEGGNLFIGGDGSVSDSTNPVASAITGAFNSNFDNTFIFTYDSTNTLAGNLGIHADGDIDLGFIDGSGNTVSSSWNYGGADSVTYTIASGDDLTLNEAVDFDRFAGTGTNTLNFTAGTQDVPPMAVDSDDMAATITVAGAITSAGNSANFVFGTVAIGSGRPTSFVSDVDANINTAGGDLTVEVSDTITLSASVDTEAGGADNSSLLLISDGAITQTSNASSIVSSDNGTFVVNTNRDGSLDNGADVILNNDDNDYNNGITIAAANNVTLNDGGAFGIGSAAGVSNIAGNLVLTAGGDIRDDGVLNVAGTTTITARGDNVVFDGQDGGMSFGSAHTFTGAFDINTSGVDGDRAGGNITLVAQDVILNNVDTSGFTTGNNNGGSVTVTVDNDFALTGTLDTQRNGGGSADDGNVTINGDDTDNTFTFSTGSFTGGILTINGMGNATATGDTLIGFNQNNDWTINSSDGDGEFDLGGSIDGRFNDFESLTGGTGNDDFTFQNSGNALAGLLDGGDGTDSVDYRSLTSVDVLVVDDASEIPAMVAGTDSFVRNVEQLTSDNDTTASLSVVDGTNTFTLNVDGDNDGVVGTLNSTLNYADFERLQGGSGDDTFELLSGTVNSAYTLDGGDQINGDVLDATALPVLNSIDTNTLSNLSFSGLERFVATSGSRLTNATAGPTTWTISGTDEFTVDSIIYVGFNRLVGNDDADSFIFEAMGEITGLIDGMGSSGDNVNYADVTSDVSVTLETDITNIESITGSDTNSSTLIATNATNAWMITGENDGDLDGLSFTNFTSLTGGTAQDTFTFTTNTSQITGIVDGGGEGMDPDSVVLSGLATVAVAVVDDSIGSITVTNNMRATNVIGVERVTGNNDGSIGDMDNSTLTAASLINNAWSISGANEGTLNSNLQFVDFNNLTGGSTNDTFSLQNGGSVSGVIDGADQVAMGGSDTISYAAVTGAVTVDLTDGVVNIESVTGNGNAGSILAAGNSSNNTWTINGVDSGRITLGTAPEISFSNFANLTGGSADDTFNVVNDLGVSSSGILSGRIDGGMGTMDSVDYSGVDTSIMIDANADTTDGNLANIETLTGNTNSTTRLTSGDGTNVWNIAGVNSGTLTDGEAGDIEIGFTGFNVLAGGDGDDTFTFANDMASIGMADAGGAMDRDVIDLSGRMSVGTINIADISSGSATILNISGVEEIVGNDMDSTLVGTSDDTTWNITGANDGNVNGFFFQNFNQITGGSGDDDFVFSDMGSIASADAGMQTGEDTLSVVSIAGASVTVIDSMAGPVVNNITGIERVIGNNNNTLVGDDIDNTWNIDGANSGNLNGLAFTNFNNLTGGTGDDTFVVLNDGLPMGTSGSLMGLIDGGGESMVGDSVTYAGFTSGPVDISVGSNLSNIERITGNGANSTLRGANTTNEWIINGVNSGELGGLAFFNFANLVGGNDDDTFSFRDGGSIVSALAGDAAMNDTVDISMLTGARNIGITNTILGVSGVERLVGSGANTTLTGGTTTNTWLINGTNAGSASDGTITLLFEGVNNISGGSDDDTFEFVIVDMTEGSLSGTVTGGGEAMNGDTVDLSGLAVVSETADGTIRGVTGIERVIGNNIDSTLTGTGDTTTWVIATENDGTVSTMALGSLIFENFNNLTGGAGDDTFTLQAGASVTGTIDAGGQSMMGQDTADLSLLDTVDITVGGSLFGITNVERIVGNGTDSTLTGANVENTWTITGTNTGTVGTLSFEGFNNLVGGADDDTFIFMPMGSIATSVNAGMEATQDTVDLSNLTGPISESVGSTIFGVTDVERVIGNNTTSTLNGGNIANTWNITGTNTGNVVGPAGTLLFENFNSLVGGTANDTFVFSVGTSIASADGGAGAGSDTVNLAAISVVSENVGSTIFGVTGIERVIGNNSNSTLIGGNIDNTWTIDGVNDGNVTGSAGTLTFENFTVLQGGTADDTFTFNTGGSIASADAGAGAGSDTVNLAGLSAVDVNVGSTFMNVIGVERVIGNNSNSILRAGNSTNTWNLTGDNDGNISSLLFEDFNQLEGGTGVDTFVFMTDGSITTANAGGTASEDVADFSNLTTVAITSGSSIEGISGLERIIGNGSASTLTGGGAGGNNAWIINGADAGEINGLAFEDFNNLTGGAGDDTFTFTSAGSISGTADAGAQTTRDVVNLSAITMLDITASSTVSGIAGIEEVIGNNSDSTLRASNIENTWNIDGVNSGNLVNSNGTLFFTNFTDVVGGTDNDTFVFSGPGDISGTVNAGAGAGTDTVNLSALGTVNENVGTTIFGVTDVERVVGNNTNSTLIGGDIVNTWNITDENDGTVVGSAGTLIFEDFNIVQGGAATDTFVFSGSGSIANADAGSGAGTDTVNLAAIAVVNENVGNTIFGVADIERVIGNDSNSTLTGGNIANTWTIDGTNDGNVAGSAGTLLFENFTNLQGGTADDTFTFNTGGSIANADAGGGAGSDTVNLAALSAVDENVGSTIMGVTDIERVIGNNSNSILRAGDGTNTWNLTGDNDGNISGLLFEDFNQLEGGTGVDTFVFMTGGSIASANAGGTASEDVADFSNLVTANVTANTIVEGISNLERIIGNGSASTLTGSAGTNAWLINGSDSGEINGLVFEAFNNLQGGAGDDTFTFIPSGSISGTVDAGTQASRDTVNLANIAAVSETAGTTIFGVTGVERVIGNNANSTLSGTDAVNLWNITGENDGNIAGLFFEDFNRLEGGDLDDTFDFADGGNVVEVDGGGQSLRDIADFADVVGSVDLVLSTSGINNVERVVGNGANSILRGDNVATTWTITGQNDGNVNGTVEFVDFATLLGGSADDTFIFMTGGSLTGVSDAGDALVQDTVDLSNLTTVAVTVDSTISNVRGVERVIGNDSMSTLTATDVVNTWTISGENDGSIAVGAGTLAFVNFNNITGGADDDTFNVSASGSITGIIDGGAGVSPTDTVNYAAPGLDITLNTQVINVERINATASTLRGNNIANSWLINGTDSGELNGVEFSGFINLFGGTVSDTFAFTDSGSISGTVDAGDGTDTVDLNARTVVDVTANGNLFGVDNAERVIGNGSNATLRGLDIANAWVINGGDDGTLNAGEVNAVTFENFTALLGGRDDDTFTFTASGSFAGILNGGDHIVQDSIDYSALASVSTTAETNFTEVELVTGNGTSSILIGANQTNIWVVDGLDSGTLNAGTATGVRFAGFDTLQGGDLTDDFSLSGGTISTLIDGGLDTDTLTADDVANTWVLSGAFNGTVTGVAAFDDIDAVVGNNQVDSFTVNADFSGSVDSGAGADIITLSANVAGGVNAGADDDQINIAATGLTTVVDGQGGAGDILSITHTSGSTWVIDGTNTVDSVSFSGIEVANGNNAADNVTVTSTFGEINTSGGMDIVNVGADITTLNTGDANDTITVTATSDITVALDSGDGSDTLTGADRTNAWLIGTSNTLNSSFSFTGIETYIGGEGDDSFTVESGAIANVLQGRGGNDTLAVNSATGTDVSWQITGENAGNVAAIVDAGFTSIENLQGGDGDDSFVFTSNTGFLDGLIDGGASAGDTINVEVFTSGIVLEVGSSVTATNPDASDTLVNLHVNNIENLVAANDANELDDTDTEANNWIAVNDIASQIDLIWTINGRNTGQVFPATGGSPETTVNFTNFGTIRGGVGNDAFGFDGDDAEITGSIDGGLGANLVDFSNIDGLFVVTIGDNVGGDISIVDFDGVIGNNNAILQVNPTDTQTNAWAITEVNGGSFDAGSDGSSDFTFAGFNNLVGGAGQDTFNFTGVGNITGSINGGGTTDANFPDTIDATGSTIDLSVQLSSLAQATLVNGDMVMLVQDNSTSAVDIFDISLINANPGQNNTLIGNLDSNNDWTIDGQDAGELNGINFSGFANLTGGNQRDVFILDGSDTVTGLINAGAGSNDELNISGLTGDVVVELGTAVNSNLNVVGVEQLTANAGNNNTLIADDVDNDWDIDGSNAGSLQPSASPTAENTVQFSGFANLTAGALNDTFTFDDGDVITGVIDGSAGTGTRDVIDVSAITSTLTVALNAASTADVNVLGAEQVLAADNNNTLIGDNVTNAWSIDNVDSGLVNTTEFSGFANITGGNQVDTFTFEQSDLGVEGRISGVVDGADGNDVANAQAITRDITVALETSVAADINIQNVETVQANTDSQRSNTLVGFNVDSTWTLEGANQGTVEGVTFSGFANLTGGTGRDTFVFDGSDILTGVIRGGDNSDTLDTTGLTDAVTVALSTGGTSPVAGANLTVTEVEDLQAENGNSNTLLADNVANVWTLAGTNRGDVNGITFEGFANLTGGSDTDTFIFDNDPVLGDDAITGLIDGGEGSDIVDATGLSGDLVVALGNINSGDLNVTNIETINANAANTNTLIGDNGVNRWDINGINQGSVANATLIGSDAAFTGFANLTGGNSDDTFVFAAGSEVNGVLDGGQTPAMGTAQDVIDTTLLVTDISVALDAVTDADLNALGFEEINANAANNNTLIADNISNSWVINAQNSGTLNGLMFTAFANLRGRDEVDTFTFSENGALSGLVDGGANNDSLDLTSLLADITVSLEPSVAATVNVQNVENITANTSSERANTLVGANIDSTWAIAGTNAGVVDGVNFQGFANLTGGTARDTFVFDNDDVISGVVTGGDGLDTLNVVGLTEAVSVALGTANEGDINVVAVETLNAANTNVNTLLADNIANTWTLAGTNQGNVNGIEFAGFANLTGGSDVDLYLFDNDTLLGDDAVTGVIDGGGAADLVDLIGLSNDISVAIVSSGAAASASADLSVANVENIDGNATNNNTLLGNDLVNLWEIEGSNSGVVGDVTFSGFANLTGGTNNDTFVLAGDDSISGVIDGGANPATGSAVDSLDINGLNANAVVALDALVDADFNVLRLENIQANTANSNTLIASDINNNWLINSLDAGELNTTLSFSGFGNLQGREQNDVFAFTALGGVSGLVDGAGQPDGGADIVDMSALDVVRIVIGEDPVGVSAQRFINIEGFRGNNRDSVLTAANVRNDWLLNNGENTGTITDAMGNTVVFSDFNVLEGGSAQDNFVLAGGTVTGEIRAGAGDDNLQVDVIDGVVGSVNFLGNGGNDTVAINGGAADELFTADYNVLADGSVVHQYNREGDAGLTTYTVRYNESEIVNDNVFASQFNINDIDGQADTFTLENNRFNLNAFVAVNYDNKNNVAILAESGDQVNVNGSVQVANTFEVRNASVNGMGDTAQVQAAEVVFNGTGAVGSADARLALNTERLSLQTTNGDVFISEANNLEISALLSPAGNVDIEALGAITDGAALGSNQTVSLSSINGSIVLDNANNFAGPLNLTAQQGSVQLTNNRATTLGDVNAQVLTVTTAGTLTDTGSILVSGLTTINAGANSVELDSATNDFTNIAVTSASQFIARDANTVSIEQSSVTGLFDVEAVSGVVVNGAIAGRDVSLVSNTSSVDISAQLAAQNSATIQGEGVVLNSNVLVEQNTSGDAINVNAGSGTARIVADLNGGTTVAGDIVISANGIEQQQGSTISGDNVMLSSANGVSQTGNITAANGFTAQVNGGNFVAANTTTTQASNVNINAIAGDVSTALINADDVSLVSGGGNVVTMADINTVSGFNATATELVRVAGGSDVTVSAGDATLTGRNAVIDGSVTASGNVIINTSESTQVNAAVSGDQVTIDAGQQITMDSGGSVAAVQGVDLMAQGDINISQVTVEMGNVVLTSTAGAIDGVAGDSANIVATDLAITSEAGIGDSTSLILDVDTIDATNNTGDIDFVNESGLTVTRLINNGDINFVVDGDLIVDGSPSVQFPMVDEINADARLDEGSVINANFNIGNVDITVDGNVIIRSLPTSDQEPELVANTAIIRVIPTGLFADVANPFVVLIQEQLQVPNPFGGAQPLFAFGRGPNIPFVSDNLSRLTEFTQGRNDLLIEVESAEEVDPAVFTSVRPYSFDNVSIRLPRDQLFDDDDQDDEDGEDALL